MQLVFDTRGNERQKECAKAWLDPNILDLVYGGSKGSAKSYTGCSLIFGDAFMYPETSYFIARKQLNDLRKFTIPSIHEVFNNWGVDSQYYRYNGQDNFFQLYNGSRVYLLDARYQPSDPDYMRFGSMQMTRGWIEEAGEFSLEAKSNLQASIGRWKNDVYNLPPKLLMTCNPAKNFLYSDYYKKFRDGKLESYKKFIQALPQDNKMLPDGYLLNLDRTLSYIQKQRLLFGNWEYDDDPSWLVDYDAICDMFTNDYVVPSDDNYISTDLAMRGRDKFIISTWKGLVCTSMKESKSNDAKYIEDQLKKTAAEHMVARSKIVADSDGLGQYIGSYVQGIKEFHGGAMAIDKNKFANLKTECAYKLAELINNRRIKIICSEEQQEVIKEELNCLKTVNIDNDLQPARILSKDDMKSMLGRSPDYLDVLIMRMVFLLIKTNKGITSIAYKKITRNG